MTNAEGVLKGTHAQPRQCGDEADVERRVGGGLEHVVAVELELPGPETAILGC
jgi:hypothetical protein